MQNEQNAKQKKKDLCDRVQQSPPGTLHSDQAIILHSL